MANLATQTMTPAGITPTYNTCAGGGDTVTAGDNTYLHVKNPSGGPITITVDDPDSASPVGAAAFNPDVAIAVPAGAERIIGPLAVARFQNASDGLVHLTYSGAGLTMAVVATK
jgi:hypothetical protein